MEVFSYIQNKKKDLFKSKEEIVNKYGRFEYDMLKNSFRKSGLKIKYKIKENSKKSIDFKNQKDTI